MTTFAIDTTSLGERAVRPTDPGYDAARAVWNLEVTHQPPLVVVAESTDDIRAAVRYARAAGLGVGVLATGHGTGRLCDGVLVNTSRLRSVSVDPPTRRARVGAGATLGRRDRGRRAPRPHRLDGLEPSRRRGRLHPGRWLRLARPPLRTGRAHRHPRRGRAGRRRAGHAPVRPSIPTCSGACAAAPGTSASSPQLEFALHPVASVYGGNLYYPLTRSRDVLEFFADWSRTLPDELTAAVTFRSFPPLPTVPEALRGTSMVGLRGVHCGDPAEGRHLIDQARAALGPAVADTFTTLAVRPARHGQPGPGGPARLAYPVGAAPRPRRTHDRRLCWRWPGPTPVPRWPCWRSGCSAARWPDRPTRSARWPVRRPGSASTPSA